MNFNWQFFADWLSSINGPLLVVGALIVWILTQLKSIYELQKQVLNNTVLQVELVEKLFAIDQEQRNALEKLDQLASNLFRAISEKEMETAKEVRRELFTNLKLKFIGSYYKFYKLSTIIEAKSESRSLATNELIPFLEACIAYIKVINDKNVLDACNSQPYTFSPTNFQFAINYIKSEVRLWDWSIKRKLKEHEEFLKQYYRK